MAHGEKRMIWGEPLAKSVEGVVAVLSILAAGLVSDTAFAQELECNSAPVGGSADSEICFLGTLVGNGGGQARDVSADGAVVVGSGHYSGDDGFRWDVDSGLENLIISVEEGSRSRIGAVNSNGTVVVGTYYSPESDYSGYAFRWIQGTGMELLGTLDGASSSAARDVSADGRVVVGTSNPGTLEPLAFRWVEDDGMESLGSLSEGGWSQAEGVSRDGTTVVGGAQYTNDSHRAFRWVEGAGMQSFGTLLGGSVSYAADVNADGSVIVGWSDSSEGSYAVRWVEGEGVESLGTLDGGVYSVALGVNGDGNVVVGYSDSGEGFRRAFRWVEGVGMESLGTLSGDVSSFAYSVSDDGMIVVGASGGDRGIHRAFIWRELGGSMEDYENLALSFPVLANDSAVALAQSQFALGEVMDLRGFAAAGQMVMNVHAGLLHTERNPTHVGQRDTSLAAFSFGYGVSDTVTLGASLGLSGTSLKNNAFDMDTGRNLALWGVYSAGGEARTGLQLGVALGYGTSEGEVARGRLLTDVLLATGQSKVTTHAVEASLGFGIEQANGWRLTPTLSLAHFDTSRAGYAEAGAAFNATYDAMEFSRTELTLAIEGEVKLSEAGRLRLGGGVEQELNTGKPRLSGTTDLPALSTFDIEGDFVPNKTRPFVTAGYTHDFGNGSSFTADIKVSRAVYGNSPSVGVGAGYGWKF